MKSRSDMLYVLLSAAVLLFAFQRCSDDTPTEPPTTTNDTTSHEFEWEVDTLLTPYFRAKAMYATSATNVYMAGYSTSGNGCAWHWDGDEWKSVDTKGYVGRDIADVDGIDPMFIVIASYDRGGPYPFTGIFSMNYDVLTPLPLPLGTRTRTCLHVAARDEIYLGGVDGIQRYNGSEWEWLLDSTETEFSEFTPQYIYRHQNGLLEFVSLRNVTGEKNKYYLWRGKAGNYTVIDSFSRDQPNIEMNFGFDIAEGEGAAFATGYGGTFVLENHTWRRITDRSGRTAIGATNDLIIPKGWDEVWHYNGSTWKNLWQEIKTAAPTLRTIYAAVYIEDTVFLSAQLETGSQAVVVVGSRVQLLH